MVLVSHNKVHKTVETELKPVSASLNRMRYQSTNCIHTVTLSFWVNEGEEKT